MGQRLPTPATPRSVVCVCVCVCACVRVCVCVCLCVVVGVGVWLMFVCMHVIGQSVCMCVANVLLMCC